MMTWLKRVALIPLGAACVLLLCIGVLAAIVLGFMGIVVFFGALSEMMIDVAGVALFGIVTVALASICCGSGLIFLLDVCISALPPAQPELDGPCIGLSLVAVGATAGLFWATRGGHFEAVCIAADGIYLLLIAAYLMMKRRMKHDPN